MINILFFGQLRERLATDALTLDITQLSPPCTVQSLRDFLGQKGSEWQTLINADNCLVAVNQTMASNQTQLQANDEVALFPPVTGG